jgi:hypothetical protein
LLKLAPLLLVAGVFAVLVARGALGGSAPGSARLAGVVGGAHKAGAAEWSRPATLSLCAGTGAPRVVFPSDSPRHATGPGAVVWSASSRCHGEAGARVAAIGPGDVPAGTLVPRTAAGRPLAPQGPLTVSGAPHGQIVIAGARPGGGLAQQLLIEGSARGPFAAPTTGRGSVAPIAIATAYLGDVGLLAPAADPRDEDRLRVHVERFFDHGFASRVPVSTAGARSVQALTLALDYRSDALAVWAQGGAIYAHDEPASGSIHPIQRLAAAGSHLRIAALLSDDNRGIVAWSQQRGGVTSVYAELSATGVRFGAPRLLERFRDPDGLPAPSGSPSLVRLSSESVMMAWAGSADSHWVVRTAAIDLNGVRAVSTIAAPGGDALLDDLAPGPDAEALVLWTEPARTARGLPDLSRQAIFAARGIDAYPGRTIFGKPEEVAPPAPNSEATVAFDPDSDRALAVWRERAAIDYSIRAPSTP